MAGSTPVDRRGALSEVAGTVLLMNSSAQLLHTARWHAGLSQAELANRAGTSQQAVGRYEKGQNDPSLAQLRRLLAACGMRLDLTVTPDAGLIEQPTRDLLALPPLQRLPEPLGGWVLLLLPILHSLGMPALIASKAAARLRGALIRVYDLEFWVDEETTDVASLQSALADAGARLFFLDERDPRVPSTRPRLDRLRLSLGRDDVCFRGIDDLAVCRSRASSLSTEAGELSITSPDDTTVFWHPRDRDRLALQRALHLRRELAGPPPL
jgi:transcriptional regulator with XRE-family HTH domain